MYVKIAITGICSLLFLMIGVDKFVGFMDPPCSVQDHIAPWVWKLFGILQIAAAILIWLPKFRKSIAGFFTIFMLVFTSYHLSQGTYDVGGAIFMAVLLGILVWDPKILTSKRST